MEPDSERRFIEIFRSPRKEEMYLYVDRAQGTKDVPESLMKQFGEPQSVMTMLLDAQRKLARVNAADVLAGIAEQGFFLQMPPTPEQLRRRNECSD